MMKMMVKELYGLHIQGVYYIPECSGSITVYLSLVLLLLLSLIFTITEGARVITARVNTERSMSTAMDSVLAEYYGPLWEEYHLFGLNTEADNDTEKGELIASKLSEYMSYTLQPDRDLVMEGNNVDLYQVSINTAQVEHETNLMDYQGKLIINEAVEYMKYCDIGNGLEQLLGKLSLLKTPEKVSNIYEEKQKAEEQLVEIDRGILDLMELLDGVKTSKKGIEIRKDGSLKTTSYFVKKICLGEVTKENVGINQEQVFLALKGNYLNPTSDFTMVEADFNCLFAAQRQMEEYQAEIEADKAKLSAQQMQLTKLTNIAKKTKENKKTMKALMGSIDALNGEINVSAANIWDQKENINGLSSAILVRIQKLSAIITGVEPTISKAINAVDSIIGRTQTAAPIIEQYEELVNRYKGQLDGEVYTGLTENLSDIKKYIQVEDNGYDFTGMKEILKEDAAILCKVKESIDQGEHELLNGAFSQARDNFASAQASLQGYRINGLYLDYSTLILDHSGQESSLSTVSNLLQAGITDLIVDPGQVSKGELSRNALPSEIAVLSQGDDESVLTQLSGLFKNVVSGGKSNDRVSIFDQFGNGVHVEDLAGGVTNELVEHLLYQEYLKEHFVMYRPQGDKPRKPSVLDYEQEYLLVGKHTDQDNIASVISRIVFLRTILDFTSILGDSARRNEARAAAAVMVGFTGLPILIEITKVMILLAWSFAEALLDVCALMQGKTVPVIKKVITLQLPELFLISRSFLQNKVSKITDTKGLSMTYQDYLRMFLFMKDKKVLAYRSLDLMQEDIKLRYNVTSFCIADCLFGYEATVDYTIPTKFTGFGFVQKILKSGNRGFRYQIKAACSY